MEKYGIDLNRYSEVIVEIGLNLQRGEELVISAPVESVPLVRAVTEYAYKKGAKLVTVFYSDDEVAKQTYLNVSLEQVEQIPTWLINTKDYVVDSKAVYLGIISEDPAVFNGVDPQKIVARQKAIVKACPRYRKSLDTNSTRWCLVAFPNENWAKVVFGKDERAIDKLGEKIATAMWIDKPNYLQLWQEHCKNLQNRSEILKPVVFSIF